MPDETPTPSLALKPLIIGLAKDDPKLYEALNGIINNLGVIERNLYPFVKAAATVDSAALADTPVFTDFAAISQRVLRLRWAAASNATSYELRRGDVTLDWDTADFIEETTQVETRLDPIVLVTPAYYLLKAININGVASEGTASIVVTFPAIPAFNVGAQVIDNNVLLRWTEPASTWEIAYYKVYRDATFLGFIDSSFFVIFETTSGLYTYRVIAVDIANNESDENIVTTFVNQPPDFELLDTFLSTLNGTIVNGITVPTGILYCVDTAEAFGAHFSTRLWATIQAQITAGYPIYIQPGALLGSYEETVDYGGLFNNVILNMQWTMEQLSLAGDVNVTSTIQFSTDNITYTAAVPGPAAFSASFRYARIHFDFVADNDQSLAIFKELVLLLDVKREVDSGVVLADSTDVGGTVVLFNKTFKDIDSITLSARALEPLKFIYDFTDVPNPTQFRVFVFDGTGHRADYLVSWKARGIV